ncbi:MAG: division/cell wall cluster transcriptional repressor MraZ [Planctomycetes bacterium]|jgi:division/cell wall cluster transcriptional repressor MraZ|nr:division/cell wall cluster transcriptional repressor MraZ [Phycisphaerae bacterium]NBB94334.1 division/cell wall cluster transcriptional repressor MraZ [Planctomycetota bacterium]
MPFFTGEHETAIGAKRRLAINSALREEQDPEDGEQFYLVLGPDKHLWLYPDGYYRKLASRMKRSLLPSRQVHKMSLFFAMARLLKPDSQGRVVLPEKSLQRAGLDKVEMVTLLGKGDHIEIWPTDEWEQVIDEAMPNYGEMLYEAADLLDGEMADDT